MDDKKTKQPIEITNESYNKFLDYIKREMDRRRCSQNRMAEVLGVSGATLGEKLRKINRLFGDDMCRWMDILGVKIFYPGEDPPAPREDTVSRLQERLESQSREIDLLKELCEERNKRIKEYEKRLEEYMSFKK